MNRHNKTSLRFLSFFTILLAVIFSNCERTKYSGEYTIQVLQNGPEGYIEIYFVDENADTICYEDMLDNLKFKEINQGQIEFKNGIKYNNRYYTCDSVFTIEWSTNNLNFKLALNDSLTNNKTIVLENFKRNTQQTNCKEKLDILSVTDLHNCTSRIRTNQDHKPGLMISITGRSGPYKSLSIWELADETIYDIWAYVGDTTEVKPVEYRYNGTQHSASGCIKLTPSQIVAKKSNVDRSSINYAANPADRKNQGEIFDHLRPDTKVYVNGVLRGIRTDMLATFKIESEGGKKFKYVRSVLNSNGEVTEIYFSN